MSSCKSDVNSTLYVEWPINISDNLTREYFNQLRSTFIIEKLNHPIQLVFTISQFSEQILLSLKSYLEKKPDARISLSINTDPIKIINELPINLVHSIFIKSTVIVKRYDNYWQTLQGLYHLCAAKGIKVFLTDVGPEYLSQSVAYGFNVSDQNRPFFFS